MKDLFRMKVYVIFLFSLSLCKSFTIDGNWWKHTNIYDIYVWTFKDSNNDGLGDIKGLITEIDYLKNLGISAIKLSQIFSSSGDITESYAVDNFYEIHQTLGTIEDFNDLVKEAKARDIKIILDINLNHCHISHEWFQKSLQKIKPYTNYFIWENRQPNEDAKVNRPPNDWTNALNKCAWRWNSKRKQFYYNNYNFLSPDLNMRNPDVKKEIEKILRFWFDKGVSGFNFLEIGTYFEFSDYTIPAWERYNYKECFEFIRDLRAMVDLYNKDHLKDERMLMTEIKGYNEFRASEFFGSKKYPIFHFVTTTKLKNFNPKFSSIDFFNQLDVWINFLQNGVEIEWMLEGPEYDRIANKNNKEAAEVLILIQSLLPGSMRIYYGMELGMSEHYFYTRKCVDMPWEYYNTKTLPMQWDISKNAGFSKSDCPILKPNPNYSLLNVESEKQDKSSTYNFIKSLLKLRQTDILKYGSVQFSKLSDTILIISREYNSEYAYSVISLNNIPEIVKLPKDLVYTSNSWKVLASTPNNFYREGDSINPQARFVMRPLSCMILKNSRYEIEYEG